MLVFHMKQIVLDTETTGLSVNDGHRVIEIACLEISASRQRDNFFYARINPEREIDDCAAQVHGFTLADLKSEPVFSAIAPAFLRFISGAELLIHHAPFDVAFLDAELARLNLPCLESTCVVTDTLQMAREMYPGQGNSLDMLCRRLKIERGGPALGVTHDVQLLAKVYLAMTGRLHPKRKTQI